MRCLPAFHITGFPGFLGREKDQSPRGSLDAVMQYFDGKDLYASLMVTSAFAPPFLFFCFMEKNGTIYRLPPFRYKTGRKKDRGACLPNIGVLREKEIIPS